MKEKIKKDAEKLLSSEWLELKGGKDGLSSVESGCFLGCDGGCSESCKSSCRDGNSSGLSTPI